MKKLILSLALLTSGCALAMDMETLQGIHKEHFKTSNEFQYRQKVIDNPDLVTPEILEISYQLEKNSLPDPESLHYIVPAFGFGPPLHKASATAFLVRTASFEHLEKIKTTTNIEQQSEIANKIASLCNSKYFYMIPARFGHTQYIIRELVKKSKKYESIGKNSVLQNIITEFADNQ